MSLLDTASLICTPNGYKEGKLYSVIPSDGSGDLSVTRATTATRVNSAGLVELVPYNLIEYSQEFSNSSFWGYYVSSVSANTAVAPDGTTTADTITISNTNGSVYQSEIFSEGIYTLSCYFKKTNEDNVYMDGSSASGGYFGASFNLTTLATTIFGGGFLPTIESVGNGWYRCSVRSYANGSGSFGIGVYSGAGKSVYAWGAQLNEGTLKDYQKTETRLNIPRLDYSNGTCPSILVEPQRTNLLLQSSSFSSLGWQNCCGASITSNSTISPNGIQDADTYGTSQSAQLWQTVAASTNTTYTLSMWVKLGTATNLCLVANNTAAWNTIGGQSFDSSDGLNTSTWTRIEFTFTTPSLLPAGAINIHIGGNAETGLTQSTGTVFIWGAQLEAGSYATSYIPTTSASVTRNADVISKTGISSLIGQTEGTIFLDFVLKNPLSATNRIISITESNWLSGGSIRLDIDYNQIKADFVNGGSNIGSIIYSTTPLQNTRYKVAIAYKENDCQMYINGVDAGSDTTTAAMPTCSELYLNALGGGFNAPYEASNINASALWKTRLTNAQLAQLTTI